MLGCAVQFYVGSPAPGPEGGYQEILAPETAPAGKSHFPRFTPIVLIVHTYKKTSTMIIIWCTVGHESPAKVDSKIIKNPDGSTSVQLGEGSIGNFTLPTVNGTIPAQNGVKLIFGRKMLQVLLEFPASCTQPPSSPSLFLLCLLMPIVCTS